MLYRFYKIKKKYVFNKFHSIDLKYYLILYEADTCLNLIKVFLLLLFIKIPEKTSSQNNQNNKNFRKIIEQKNLKFLFLNFTIYIYLYIQYKLNKTVNMKKFKLDYY